MNWTTSYILHTLDHLAYALKKTTTTKNSAEVVLAKKD